MSAEIVLHRPAETQPALTAEQIDLIRRTICNGATDDELQLFILQCNRFGFDPFNRQIHAIKRWDAPSQRDTMTIQVGIDGYRLIAERTGNYVPGREPTFTYVDNQLYSATSYVKVYRKNEWHEVAATALYAEYVQTKKDGAPVGMWAKMPHSQLAKCAESLALRKAFPAELSGTYSNEEMQQADSDTCVVAAPAAGEPMDASLPLIPQDENPPAASKPAASTLQAVTAAIKQRLESFGYDGKTRPFLCRLFGCEPREWNVTTYKLALNEPLHAWQLVADAFRGEQEVRTAAQETETESDPYEEKPDGEPARDAAGNILLPDEPTQPQLVTVEGGAPSHSLDAFH